MDSSERGPKQAAIAGPRLPGGCGEHHDGLRPPGKARRTGRQLLYGNLHLLINSEVNIK